MKTTNSDIIYIKEVRHILWYYYENKWIRKVSAVFFLYGSNQGTKCLVLFKLKLKLTFLNDK